MVRRYFTNPHQFQTFVVLSSFTHKDYNLHYILNFFASVQCFAVADPGFSLGEGAPIPKVGVLSDIFAEKNCMKMKEFGPRGRPWHPPWIRQCFIADFFYGLKT